MSMAPEIRHAVPSVPIPQDMFIPNDSSIEVPWGDTLTLHFTESCWVDTDKPDAFLLPDGEGMPDGTTCCAGSVWGPGTPQDGYQDTDITITTSAPEPGVCDEGSRQAGRTRGAHVIHIGSSVPLADLLKGLFQEREELASTWPNTEKILMAILLRERASLATPVRRFLRDLIRAGNAIEGSRRHR
jgi:hypothetical protein